MTAPIPYKAQIKEFVANVTSWENVRAMGYSTRSMHGKFCLALYVNLEGYSTSLEDIAEAAASVDPELASWLSCPCVEKLGSLGMYVYWRLVPAEVLDRDDEVEDGE